MGLLLQAGMRVCLLADVQTGLEEESSGGHGGQSGRVAGRGGRGATAAGGGGGRRGGGRGGGLRGLMPGAVLLSTHRGLLGGQGSGGGGVEHGRGRKHGSGRSRRRLVLGQVVEWVLHRSCLGGLDLRLRLVLNL